MKLTQHPSNNFVLAPPKGAKREQVAPAPVTKRHYADGTDSVCTFWKPSDEEVLALARGGYVELEVLGTTMPPVKVRVDP